MSEELYVLEETVEKEVAVSKMIVKHGFIISKFSKRKKNENWWHYDDMAVLRMFETKKEALLQAAILGIDLYEPSGQPSQDYYETDVERGKLKLLTLSSI